MDRDGARDAPYAAFSDIINALIAATPEQLQHSLDNLDRIAIQGDAAADTPLIDLTAARNNGEQMMQMLQQQMVPDNLQQIDLTRPVVSGAINTADQGPNAGDPAAAVSLNGAPPGVGALGLESQAGTPLPAAKSDGQVPPLPVGGEPTKNIVSNQLHTAGPNKGSGEHTAGPNKGSGEPFSQQQARLSDMQMTKPVADSIPPRQVSHAPASNEFIGSSDLPPAAIGIEEPSAKKVGRMESQVSRLPASPHVEGGMDQVDPYTGRQFSDLDGGGREKPQYMKNEVNGRLAKELSADNSRPALWENTTATSMDTQESLNGAGRADGRVDLQASAVRMKIASHTGAENVSGHQETISQTSEPQTNVIRQIVQRMTLHTQGLQSSMTVKLKPEFLGNVHMQISTDNQQVVVRMATESLAVKEMVEQGLQFLKTELQHHGLEIDKFDVFVAEDKEGSKPGQDPAGFRQALKERNRNAHGQNPDSNHNEAPAAPPGQGDHGRTERQTSEIDYFA
jgi:hypothetical protein